jgi:hypothetical protein
VVAVHQGEPQLAGLVVAQQGFQRDSAVPRVKVAERGDAVADQQPWSS